MEVTIIVPEWVGYVGITLIIMWSIDIGLSVYKRYLEWEIKKLTF